MANYGKIVITVDDFFLSIVGETIDIVANEGAQTNYNPLVLSLVRSEGKFKYGGSNSAMAANFAAAFQADYGVGGIIESRPVTVSVVDNVVTIEFTQYGWSFDVVPVEYADWYSWVITAEDVPESTFTLTGVSESTAASTPCLNIRRTFTETDGVYPISITSPVTKTCNASGDLWFDYLRAYNGIVTMVDDVGTPSSLQVNIVDVWSINQVSLSYLNGTANAYIEMEWDYNGIVAIFEYSLDGTTWQPGNTFYGLFTDDYTAYVRDQWGCTKSLAFSITVIPDPEKPEPFFEITPNQSFTFKKLLTFDNDALFPNQFNALYEQQSFKNRQFVKHCQRFNKSDSRPVQIRSTFATQAVKLIDSDGVDALTVVPTLKKQYVGLKDARDCMLRDAGNNQTYMYFINGQTYDYTTEVANGSYSLAGKLESWMYDIEAIQNVQIIGTTSMDGQYEVAGRDYDSLNKVSVLIINVQYDDVDQTAQGISKFVYNAEDFDVYEAVIPLAAFEGFYHLEATASDTDPRYTNQVWISEPIWVETLHADHVLIEWSDTKVIDDCDFSTGIEHIARIEGVFYKFGIDGEKETMEDDQGRIIPLKAIKKKQLTLETNHLPPYMVDKLTTAITHDNITINSLPIQTAELGEIEQVEGNSMQKLTITCQYNETVTYFDDNSIITPSSGLNVLGVSDQDVLGA